MKRAIFIDRDNTIIHNDGDLGDPAEVRLIRGAAHAIGSLRQLGYRIIVVTNQAGVARGAYTEADVDAVHQRIAELVYEASGAVIDRFYYCPYHPDGTVREYAREHPWRKPSPGMLLEAARSLDLNLEECWMVGDQERDVEAGLAAGTQTILISNESAPQTRAHFNAATLAESAAIIAQNRTRSRNPILKPGEPITVASAATKSPPTRAAPSRAATSSPESSTDLEQRPVSSTQQPRHESERELHDESGIATAVRTDDQNDESQTDLFADGDDRAADDSPTVEIAAPSTRHESTHRTRKARRRLRLRHPDARGAKRDGAESGPSKISRLERQLIDLHSEIRAWRHSQREFTPAIMLGILGILALIVVAVFVAVYVEGPTAQAWIGVALVAQVGVVGLLVLGLRR